MKRKSSKRNPAPRGGAVGAIGNGIEPHLERIGIRTQEVAGDRKRRIHDEELRQICMLAVHQVH